MKTSSLLWGIGAVAAAATVYVVATKGKSYGTTAPPPLQDPTGRPVPPPPGTEAVGPRAQRIVEFIDSLDDDDIAALRAATPDPWWDYLTIASQTRPDEMVPVILNPMTIDIALMSEQEGEEMRSKILWGIGLPKSLVLRSILNENNVT